MSGQNVAFSTSSTLLQYCLFFSLAFISSICSGDCRSYRMAVGFTTLMSANTFWYGTNSPLTLTSSLASCAVFADLALYPSPVSDSREGSTLTSWHACCNKSAVRSLSSLCLIDVNPPRWHDNACATLKVFPHAQLAGIFVSGHP